MKEALNVGICGRQRTGQKTLLARRFLFYDLIYGLFDLNDVTPDD